MKVFLDLDVANTTIITPNRRLSATLLKKYNYEQAAKDHLSWETLDVLPFTSWIQRLWQDYCSSQLGPTPLILTTQQEQIVWEEILNQSPTNDALLQLSATAELAKSAWGTLKQWQVSTDHPAFALTEDSSAFQLWAEQFQIKCHENHWASTPELLDLVHEKIAAGHIQLPKKIILVGFTEYTPQQKGLFTLCSSLNTKVHFFSEHSTIPHQTQGLIGLINEDTEIYTMACWAKSLLERSTAVNIDCAAISIGCVVPHLEKTRDKILHTFSQVFSAEKTLTLDPTTLPFNISAGKSLSTYPIIHSALLLLQLNTQTITNENVSHLLHTPFIADAEDEHIKRAQFDVRIRNANLTITSLNQLLHTTDKINLAQSCPQLAKHIKNYITYKNQKIQPLLPSEWAHVFTELLTILGWPGERSVNSQEYQVIQRWLELLHEYQTLDYILSLQTYQQALHYLEHLATKTIFQVQSPEAPIQILGLLEAAAIPFDYLWVMGLDDTTWPPAAKPNPFIPQRLQKSLNMPHASAERELIYSRQLTEQFKQSAQHCLFSYPLKSADNELRPSSLITHVNETTIEALTLSKVTSPAEIIFQSSQCEVIQDNEAPSILPEEKIRGGARIFKQQAACPFKAFVEIRLHAQPIEPIQIGLRAQDRGMIVHKTLELIWRTLQSSENLSNLSTEELTTLIKECGTIAIEQMTGKKIHAIRYLTLELQRLIKLIFDWLMIEKERPPFKVIAQEKEISATFANIPLTLRVDRIDELADGTYLIIDYKTGKNNSMKSWFSERPDEPQLPLYCLLQPNNTIGIAFAEIHPDLLSFKGICQHDIDIPSIKPIFEVSYTSHLKQKNQEENLQCDNQGEKLDHQNQTYENRGEKSNWQKQMQEWTKILNQLGNDFYQGKAAVDPKIEESCQHCHLHALCRIHENELIDSINI